MRKLGKTTVCFMVAAIVGVSHAGVSGFKNCTQKDYERAQSTDASIQSYYQQGAITEIESLRSKLALLRASDCFNPSLVNYCTEAAHVFARITEINDNAAASGNMALPKINSDLRDLYEFRTQCSASIN